MENYTGPLIQTVCDLLGNHKPPMTIYGMGGVAIYRVCDLLLHQHRPTHPVEPTRLHVISLVHSEQLLTSVLVCTDLSSKEPHRQVSVDRIVTSGSLCGVMVSTLT